ncbi:GNAT family N-acetyltransferase [Nonomuraea sp. NPDC049725]|uniref:GNAT family N-acetyltransferase n=1 Tax=Nonomuraea sp. NPDC049725 TaxID=3154508 RepID=UPI00343F27EC
MHNLILELADHLGQIASIGVSVTDLQELLTRPEITYLLAERDSLAVGYVSWMERINFWSGQDYLHIDDVFVTGGQRGRGVGEQLMRAASEAAKGQLIRWEVAEDNLAAQRFSTRIGATLTTKKIGRLGP